MRVSGLQCDTCAKQAVGPTGSRCLPGEMFPVPPTWFLATTGDVHQESLDFCSGKCLSEWALKQDMQSQPKEVEQP